MPGQFVCYAADKHPYPLNGQNVAFWKAGVKTVFDPKTRKTKLVCPICGEELVEE